MHHGARLAVDFPLALGPMVAIAQLVEHRVVVAGAAGSSPVSHPTTKAPRSRGGLLSFAAAASSSLRRIGRQRPARSRPR